MRRGELVASLAGARAGAATPAARVALPRAAAAHEADEPGAERDLLRADAPRRPGGHRARCLARHDRPQLGRRARRALDLAARRRLRRGARRMAGRGARAHHARRATDAMGGQRRPLARRPQDSPRRPRRTRVGGARGRRRLHAAPARRGRCGAPRTGVGARRDGCSIAGLELDLEPGSAGEASRSLRSAHGGVYELGMRERDHGVPIAPFDD